MPLISRKQAKVNIRTQSNVNIRTQVKVNMRRLCGTAKMTRFSSIVDEENIGGRLVVDCSVEKKFYQPAPAIDK